MAAKRNMVYRGDIRKYLTLQCRNYNGEEVEPIQMSIHLPNNISVWGVEKLWVDWSVLESSWLQKIDEDTKTFGIKRLRGDKTPLRLKTLLFTQNILYLDNVKLEEEKVRFDEWYSSLYLTIKTNREKRADTRRKELIARCLYYKGEKENPWEGDFSKGYIRYRKHYWRIEHDWVEALSYSYNSPMASHYFVKKLNMHTFFRNEGRSLSLMSRILEWHWLDDYEFNAWEDYKNSYLKLVPLGRGVEKYFNFYAGESDNPWDNDRDTTNGLFWFWESMVAMDDMAEHVLEMYKEQYCDDCPLKDYPKEYQALFIHISCMAGKWMPYDDPSIYENKYMQGVEKEIRYIVKLDKCRFYGYEKLVKSLPDTGLIGDARSYFGEESDWMNSHGEHLQDPKADDGMDDVPLSLKSWMYGRYLNMCSALGGPEDYQGFKNCYLSDYLLMPTNREKRFIESQTCHSYNKTDWKKYLLTFCLHYHGGRIKQNEPNSLFAGYEKQWLEAYLKGDGKFIKSLHIEALDSGLTVKRGDRTPLTLKALLLNRFLHWNGNAGYDEDMMASFEEWYENVYKDIHF